MRSEHQLSVRLAVAASAAVALLVPFAVIAAMVVTRSDSLRHTDAEITDALHSFALTHPHEVTLMAVWSVVFHPTVIRIAAVLLVAWLVRRKAWAVAIWVAVTMVAGGVLGVVLKLIFGRNRPEMLDPVARAPGYSFPSGHAMTAALGSAVFLLVLLPLVRDRPWARRALWTAAVIVPLVTGISRVGLGVHWTSDVVAGWLFGVALVAATATVFLARGRRRAHRKKLDELVT